MFRLLLLFALSLTTHSQAACPKLLKALTTISTQPREAIYYIKAKRLALYLHREQTYGEHPFANHLKQVQQVLTRFGFSHIHPHHLRLRSIAWLHDILEDTHIPFEILRKLVGKHISESVLPLTLRTDISREEALKTSLTALKNHPDSVIVKIADRIANVESCLGMHHSSKDLKCYQQYVEEWQYLSAAFRSPLKKENEVTMWEYLNKLMNE